MRIVCLQHVPFEGPGNIASWARERGHSLRSVHLFAGEAPPSPDEFDWLVVMGGPMSVNDEAEYAWLAPEKKLVRTCIERGKFVLGVCLGSQLIADVLGSPVYRNRVREIGWFPIRLRPEAAGSRSFAGLPEQMQVLHWHGETFDLPPGCKHLAESEGCRVQAFEHPSALGLQFHLEMTAEGLDAIVANCSSEIGSGPYEVPPERLVAGEKVHGAAAKSLLYQVLDNASGAVD
jgi:GMP synthase-like glutamine amidotransferase